MIIIDTREQLKKSDGKLSLSATRNNDRPKYDSYLSRNLYEEIMQDYL